MKFETLSCLIMNNQFAILYHRSLNNSGDFCPNGDVYAHTQSKLSFSLHRCRNAPAFFCIQRLTLCGGEA